MVGDEYAEDRQYGPIAKACAVILYILNKRRPAMVTVQEVMPIAGIQKSRAYVLLDTLCEPLGMYKDGRFYVLLPEP